MKNFNVVIKNFNKSVRNGQNTYANIMKLHWLTRVVEEDNIKI